MAKVETDVYTFKDDVGKNLYRSKKYYTLVVEQDVFCLLYTSPSPRDRQKSRMPSSA